jgi:hypothetical protein
MRWYLRIGIVAPDGSALMGSNGTALLFGYVLHFEQP